MTFADCEWCTSCSETEKGCYCEWYGTEIERVNQCDKKDEE